MIEAATYQRKLPQHSCAGKISEVFLIETEGTHDLPYFLQWIRLSMVRRGVLLLVNIDYYSQASKEILQEIANHGIEIITADLRDPADSLKSRQLSPGPRNSYALPATDVILSFSCHPDGDRKTLYIGDQFGTKYHRLKYDYKFRNALRKLHIDTIACRDNARPLMEGGDYLLVGEHLFIGTRTLRRFGPDAENEIRKYYNLCENLQVHFIGVDDPDPSAGLYHLDLYFTYGGMNENGVHRFFSGYMDETSVGDTSLIISMRAQLEKFKEDIIAALDETYSENYELTGVPIICCDMYRVSPLNGITDYVNGTPKYFFPWPEFVNAIEHPEYNTQNRITSSVQKAYDIVADKMGENNVLRFKVPIGYTAGAGQSLHCTMAVISREIN